MPLNHLVGFCGAVAFLALIVIGIAVAAWQELGEQGRKCGKAFLAVFAVGTLVATIHAQKPPVVKAMKLTISNETAKGFDCEWDYGGLDPAGFTEGETVRLTAEIMGLDYTLLIGTLPPSVTNYHVYAVLRGLPKDWMAHDVKVTARLNNANLTGEANREGDDSGELPSINGGNE